MSVLENTNASKIAAALVDARRAAGSPAMGMVMTLVVVVPDEDAERALIAARDASREHPSRRLGIVIGSSQGPSRIDADIKAGGAGASGERALIRLTGEVADHAASVVLPLLLPDSPVVVWWPTVAPEAPAEDPIGRLGNRRITDAAEVPREQAEAMLTQCRNYAPGNTDLAWTRITPWRALLASAMDQVHGKVSAIEVTAEPVSPSADLLGAWLADRLKAPVTRHEADGPGVTGVTLRMAKGDISLTRDDMRSATLSVPGQPDRPVALRRRELAELLTEELRRLDPDDIYAETVRKLHQMSDGAETKPDRPSKPKKGTKGESSSKEKKR